MKKSLFITVSICFALTFGMPALAGAQTSCPPANVGDVCPFTGTVGLETGLQDLAFVQMNALGQNGHGAMVDWGDQSVTIGLVRCFEPILHPHHCHVFGTHIYATTGTHQIVIHYDPPIGSEETVGVPATISSVKDFVILSIGDSVASGEGDPVVQFGGPVGCQPTGGCIADSNPPQGFWDDPGSNYSFPPVIPQTPPEEAEVSRSCHRSLIGGPAQAAGLIAASNPITFMHFACSGASVGQIGIPQADLEKSNIIEQVRLAREHLERIDVLLISGGFNNMTFRTVTYGIDGVVHFGFGKLVMRCLDPFQPCQEDTDFTTDINDSINGNPSRILPGNTEIGGPEIEFTFPGLAREYQDLDKEIHCINPDNDGPEPNCSEKQIPKLVLITEFFDPTHDESGGFGSCLVPKARWAYINSVITSVNRQVALSPWPEVGGIQNDFQTHGLCADGAARWVVTLPESLAIQNDKNGTGHPNGSGHADYRDRIYARIVELNPPVTTASATAGGSPYAFGTWTTHDATVTLSAMNAIKESGVLGIFYAVDNPNCQPNNDFPDNPPGCSIYTGPFTIATSGKHTVTFFSENAQGHPDAVQSVQVWVDNEPPVMTCAATPSVLWPPNNKMVPVALNVTAVSAAFGPTPFSLKSVTTSAGNAATDVAGFVIGQPSLAGFLRASRPGNAKAGETYTFVYQSVDPVGLTGTCAATVTVPHDQGKSNP